MLYRFLLYCFQNFKIYLRVGKNDSHGEICDDIERKNFDKIRRNRQHNFYFVT